MKRSPSIHITEDRLIDLIRQFYDYDDNADDMIADLVPFIMENGLKYSLEKRTLVLSNQVIAKKALNKVTNDKSDINLLSGIIFSVRKNLKHIGIKPIDNNSPEWVQIKKLTPIVNEYCNAFNLNKRDGYIDYVQRGLHKISSFRGYLTKLYDMSESISLEKEADILISNDKHRKLTREIHDYYVQLIAKQSGIVESFEHKPIKYAKFIQVKDIVIKMKVPFEEYIDSQFEQLDWTGSYPEPEQLINEKSGERFNKHMFQKQKQGVNNKVKTDRGLTDVLKNIKNGKNRDQ
jgi:hypothetical protein